MRQLIKHEFMDSLKFNIIGLSICLGGYILYGLVALITMVVNVESNIIVTVIATSLSMILLGTTIVPIVFFIITIKKSCIDKIFNDEGYLTMSLPVTTNKLIMSKLIVLIIWGVAYVIANYIGSLILLLILNAFSNNPFEVVKSIIENTLFSGLPSVISIFKLLAYLIKIVLAILLVGSLTNFCRAKKNKTLLSIGIVALIIFSLSILNTLAGLLPFGLLYTSSGYQFAFGLKYDASYVLNFTQLIIDIVIVVLMYFINYRIIDKDLELV